MDRRDEQALLGLARLDGRPRVAPREERRPRVEPQSPLLFLLAVALETILGQGRADLRLEEPGLFARRFDVARVRERPEAHEHCRGEGRSCRACEKHKPIWGLRFANKRTTGYGGGA